MGGVDLNDNVMNTIIIALEFTANRGGGRFHINVGELNGECMEAQLPSIFHPLSYGGRL